MTVWGWTLFSLAVAPWIVAGFIAGWFVAADRRRARSKERDLSEELDRELHRILRGSG